jgi:hypothetical protein
MLVCDFDILISGNKVFVFNRFLNLFELSETLPIRGGPFPS